VTVSREEALSGLQGHGKTLDFFKAFLLCLAAPLIALGIHDLKWILQQVLDSPDEPRVIRAGRLEVQRNSITQKGRELHIPDQNRNHGFGASWVALQSGQPLKFLFAIGFRTRTDQKQECSRLANRLLRGLPSCLVLRRRLRAHQHLDLALLQSLSKSKGGVGIFSGVGNKNSNLASYL
jgi:hypothetical protein